MFCKKTPTTSKTLGLRRLNILHTFIDAKNNLAELISDQEAYGQNINEQIQSLQEEQNYNDLDIKSSKSILSKINNLLN